ncbi:MAG TPA: four helix bundle suffix domain-containing protein [Candidatus Sumerlaeota bacterium]|nr:four helix bundle suffix domain-containing protein [Candidatus Sumerlaeota bacterium]
MSRLRKSGGYRDLGSFKTATIIYDATYWFCEKFLEPRSRMVDQMIQAARSGRQIIAEGRRAAATSSQTELRLLNVARSSLEELLLDYENFLRHRRLPQWAPDSAEAEAVRGVLRAFRLQCAEKGEPTDQTHLTDQQRWALYAPWLEHDNPGLRANTLICLIHQANYLLDQQISVVEKQFIEAGGYSETLAAARLAERNRQSLNDPSDPSDRTDRTDPSKMIPPCPVCGKPMVLRTARTGKSAGQSFWGCSVYPECRGIVKG